jgi:hypothetical protein
LTRTDIKPPGEAAAAEKPSALLLCNGDIIPHLRRFVKSRKKYEADSQRFYNYDRGGKPVLHCPKPLYTVIGFQPRFLIYSRAIEKSAALCYNIPVPLSDENYFLFSSEGKI